MEIETRKRKEKKGEKKAKRKVMEMKLTSGCEWTLSGRKGAKVTTEKKLINIKGLQTAEMMQLGEPRQNKSET